MQQHELVCRNKNWRRICAGAGVLAVIGVISYRSTASLIDAAEMRSHTFIVLGNLEGLLSLTQGAETGQRGFLITGADRYLEPYNAATNGLDSGDRELRKLTADNPNQQRRLDAIRPAADRPSSTS